MKKIARNPLEIRRRLFLPAEKPAFSDLRFFVKLLVAWIARHFFIRRQKKARVSSRVIYTPEEKMCRACGIQKPRAAFYLNKALTDGISSWCKACQIRRSSAARIARAQAEVVKLLASHSKRCSKCGKEKTRNQFSRNRTHADGFSNWCKACHKVVAVQHKNAQLRADTGASA